MNDDDLLTAPEAARMLKLKLPAFYALRRRQRIPNAGLGRRLLFARGDLLRARTTESPQAIDFAARARQLVRGELRRA